MRAIKVTFANGDYINTSMAPEITDAEILSYYRIGSWFNIGSGPNDNMQQVTKCEIIS